MNPDLAVDRQLVYMWIVLSQAQYTVREVKHADPEGILRFSGNIFTRMAWQTSYLW